MIRLSLRTKSILTALLPVATILCILSLGRWSAPSPQLFWGALFASIAVGITAGALSVGAMKARISRLMESANLVATGVPIRSVESSHDELAQLANAMALMSRQVLDQKSELRDLSARLDAILRATTGICILGTSLDGTITFCNPGAEKMLGYHQASLVGRPLISTVHPGEDAVGAAVTKTLSQACVNAISSAQELETVYVRQDGVSIDVHVSITAIRDIKGQTTGLLHVASDISARRVLEAELRFKNDHLKTQTSQQSEVVERVTQSLAQLNEAVLNPISEVSKALKTIRDTVEHPDQLRVLNECRMLAESAIDGLRQFARTTSVRSRSEHPEDALPALLHSGGQPVADTALASIDRWYQSQGALPSREARPSRGRILIVDDFEDTRALMRAYLKHLDYELDFAANGSEALAEIASNSYAVVLMDVEMPVLDGHETALRIRQWERENGRQPTPLIAISANHLTADSLPAQWTASLTKPVTKGVLLAELAKRARIS